MSVLFYSWQSFDEDMKLIEEYVKAWGRVPHFVGLVDSSLPMSVKMRNKLKTDMSIVDVTIDEDDNYVSEFIMNNIPSKASLVIVLDTVLGTGKTLGSVSEMLEREGYVNNVFMAIYDNTRAMKDDKVDIKVSNLRVSNGETIKFPWEI